VKALARIKFFGTYTTMHDEEEILDDDVLADELDDFAVEEEERY
jgi:hypothetical protein